MKSILFLLLPLLYACTVAAQLGIPENTTFVITGNVQLTLQNTNLINNGTFTAGTSIISFTGDAASSVSGRQPVDFFQLEINKTNNSALILQRSIGVSNRALFTAGFLNLNGFNTDLGSTGHLDGEQDNTRIIGPNGGEVLFTTNLNFPTNSNPANLGIFITANQNLGNVTIKRGHQSQANSSGVGSSILRYYDIIPDNNANLNATLRFRYIDGELNGLDENNLVFWGSPNNINWTNLGFTARDVDANIVEKTGIPFFERFTLSGINSALPVKFVLFNAKCQNNTVLLTWKTAQEQNSNFFNVERSADGNSWTSIGHLPAAGNSDAEKTYSFTDNSPVENSLYRIAEYDVDGKVQYSSQLKSSCNTPGAFTLWPNPVHDKLFIGIVTGNDASQATIKVFDNKGALVKEQQANLLPGSNQLSVDMSTLPNGIYNISAVWNNGKDTKTARIIKH